MLNESHPCSEGNASEIHLSNAAGAGLDPVRQIEAFARSVIFSATDENTTETRTEVSGRHIRKLSLWISEIHTGRGETLAREEADKLAIGANAVISQLSREPSLDPARITAEKALLIALDMIGPRIGVTFGAPDGAS